jgi:hypothetical protein
MNTLIWRALIFSVAITQAGIAQTAAPPSDPKASPLYVKVQIDKSLKLSSLKPGDVAEGDLARDVYSGDHKLFAAGSHVRLPVDHLERRRRSSGNQWPWVVKAFMPRHENYPVFKNAIVAAPDGTDTSLQVSLISAGRRVEMQKAKQRHRPKSALSDVAIIDTNVPLSDSDRSARPGRDEASTSKSIGGPIMSLEAFVVGDQDSRHDPSILLGSSVDGVTLPPGTACRILLLKGLSASKSHAGDLVQARLLEPLLQDSRVVMPAGTLFEGRVTRAVAPRWASRAGSLALTFTQVTFADGSHYAVATSLGGIELNRGSHTKMDSEGRLLGDRPGPVWMLINGGMTAGIAKEIDDGTQLILEAILSGATDASTAGTARIAGSIVSGIFMLTRHGRDVVLPNLTEMSITLNRPLTLFSSQSAPVPTAEITEPLSPRAQHMSGQ